jgi:UDP-4-amino-4,6-dideoxy-N-acetyl-beta-L-altrosamine transaminase
MITNERFLPYAQQSINEEDIEEVASALRSGIITRGERVEAFEQAIAEYCDVKYAVAFNSGSTALHACYFAGKTTSYDRIISTANTFVASVSTGIQYGAKASFVDIDPKTGNISLEALAEVLKDKLTRGKNIITPVHFAGVPVDMQALQSMITSVDDIIIEDAAHALGSHYSDGEKVGSCRWSDMTVFSFHPAKTITTGEGGMVTTNDPELYRRLCAFRNNGIERDAEHLIGKWEPWYYEVQELTTNTNFTDFQAALGLSQFKRLPLFISQRQELMRTYRKRLRHARHLQLLIDAVDPQIAYHLCVVKIDFTKCPLTRTELMKALHQEGIGTQVHYIPVYHHPAIKKLYGNIAENFPENERYYKEALTLPLFTGMDNNDVDRICAILRSLLKI